MSTNYIDQITDTAGTTHDISEGDSTRIFRATCSTAAGTTAKVATLQTSNRNFSLATGVRVAVTFTYGNSAATPTLRVDGSSTGTAKTIAVATSATAKTTGNGTTYNTWGPYETVLFTYDGTYWVNGGSSRAIYNAYNNIGEDTDTWRPIKVDDTQILAGTTDTNALNLKAGTGISLSNSSGTVTFNHSNSVTAKSTQAVYPITFDAQGHITGSGTAVTIPSAYTLPVATYNTLGGVKPWKSYTASSTGPTAATASTAVSVNAITNTASRYYAVEMDKDGRMFVNVPWTNVNSSYITSDSDEKLKIGAVANNTTNTTYYPILATNSTAAATRYYDSTGIHYNNINGTTSAVGSAELVLGNSTASGTANNKKGKISLYSSTSNYGHFDIADLTAQRTYTFPDKTGTVALTSDISTVPTITLNGTATTSPSFYAPTTAGTSGYVLKSNGSGAPTWTSATLTDTKVTQTASTTSAWRKVLGSYNSATAADGSITSGTTNISYYDADGPSFNTSTGELYTKGYKMYLATTDELYTAINNLGWVSAVIE